MSGTYDRQALFGLTLMAAAAGILAGCARPPTPPSPPRVAAAATLPPPAAAVRRPRPVRLPARKPVPPPEPGSPEPGGPAPEDQAMAMAAPPAAALPDYPTRSQALIGLDQKTAAKLFGAAEETSETPPATVWHWRSETCELDLYFYLDLRSGRMRSLHYVFKGDATGQQDCLKSLALAGRG
jgi:hypothetical protein